MHHGAAAIAVNATRGARPLRPFARGTLPPTLRCGAWPKQLQYAETVDARFRQLLSSPTKVPELVRAAPDVLSYLREWADRADPSHTAALPDGLQGRPPEFFDARLLELPFAFVDGAPPRHHRHPPAPQIGGRSSVVTSYLGPRAIAGGAHPARHWRG